MMKKQNVLNSYRRIKKYGFLLSLSNIFLKYFSRFLSSDRIGNITDWRYKRIEKIIINTVGEIEPLPSEEFCFENPEKAPIWWCWLQGEKNMPLIPKLCLDSLRKYSNNHPVVLITLDNFREYVSLNPKVLSLYHEGKISNAHFSDILRINLLNQNGGLWVDSTVLLTSDIDENIFKSSFFTIKIKELGVYVSKCRWSTFCLGGYKQNILFGMVSDIFDKYIEKTDVFADYFMFDAIINTLYNRVPAIKDMIDNNLYNNLNVHSLSGILNDDFDTDIFRKITEDTNMFKLNWKAYNSDELVNNRNNYFNYIRGNI